MRLHSIPSLNIRSDVDLGAAVPNADLFVLLVRSVCVLIGPFTDNELLR